MDFRLEVVQVLVSDVERAKAFYVERAGFHCDHDHAFSASKRLVQLTPPGSACSIAIGTGLSDVAPGTARLQLVVGDMDAAHAQLAGRGVEISEVTEMDRPGRPGFRFAFFDDPDGNAWTVQEIPQPRGTP